MNPLLFAGYEVISLFITTYPQKHTCFSTHLCGSESGILQHSDATTICDNDFNSIHPCLLRTVAQTPLRGPLCYQHFFPTLPLWARISLVVEPAFEHCSVLLFFYFWLLLLFICCGSTHLGTRVQVSHPSTVSFPTGLVNVPCTATCTQCRWRKHNTLPR